MTTVAFINLQKPLKIICILDTASATTTIDMDFAETMNIKLENRKQKEFIYVDRKANVNTVSCQIELISQDLNSHFKITCTAIPGFSNNCMVWPWSIFKNKHEHMKDISIPSYPEPPIGRILIGVDHLDLLVISDYKRSRFKDRPIAAKTPLGWSFFGPDPPGEFSKQSYTFQESRLLTEVITKQFEIENIGLKEQCQPYKTKVAGPKHPDIWTPLERLADALMVITLKKNPLNHLIGKIPWKQNHHIKLSNNSRAVEVRQTKSHTEASLKKKGVTMEEIDSIIKGYLQKDYIEEVPLNDRNSGWYLPFFEVINRQKSTPIRLVFDAKAKFKDT